MDISGKIIAVLPERGGVSQRTGNEWKVASYVLETIEQFPKKCAFEVFGIDRIAQFNLQVGQSVTVSMDIDAHEYNGRWFNTIRAWRVVPFDPNAVVAPAIDPATGMPAAVPPAPAPGQSAAQPFPPAPAAESAPLASGDGADDLPF